MNKWIKFILLAITKSLYVLAKFILRIFLAINGVIAKFSNLIGTIIIVICLIGISGFVEAERDIEIVGLIVGALFIVIPRIIEELAMKIFSGFGWLIDTIENA